MIGAFDHASGNNYKKNFLKKTLDSKQAFSRKCVEWFDAMPTSELGEMAVLAILTLYAAYANARCIILTLNIFKILLIANETGVHGIFNLFYLIGHLPRNAINKTGAKQVIYFTTVNNIPSTIL